jgi:hypothetical protein
MNNNDYTKLERVNIILDIINKLKNYKCINNEIINLYNINYSFINKFKEITNIYIETGITQKGILYFEEIDKKIEYLFPQKKYKKPLFVIRMK